jgi:hypothetical protein
MLAGGMGSDWGGNNLHVVRDNDMKVLITYQPRRIFQ